MAAVVASSTAVKQTFTATAPAGVSAGDLLVAVCYDSQTAAQTFTGPSGWSAPSSNASNSAFATGSIYVFYKYATGTDSYVFTGSGLVADVAISVLRITGGPASGDPFDAIGYSGIVAGQAAAVMPGAPAIASKANDLAICVYGAWDGQSVTTGPSGMTAAASAATAPNVGIFPYWQTLSAQYGIIGNRPVTWATADGVMNCTILIKDASPSSPAGVIYTQKSGATLLGGETHTIPGATSTTQSLTTAATGDLVIMFIHWAGSGITVTSLSSTHVTWAAAAAAVTDGSATGYHGEIWYGTVTSVATANVTVNFSASDTFGTELGFDEWGASPSGPWTVQATANVDSGATTNQTVTSASVTATGDGLLWTYDITDAQGFFGTAGDYGYYFTVDASNGSPVSWRYNLSAGAWQSTAWTEGGAAPGRWNGVSIVFQAGSQAAAPPALPARPGKTWQRRFRHRQQLPFPGGPVIIDSTGASSAGAAAVTANAVQIAPATAAGAGSVTDAATQIATAAAAGAGSVTASTVQAAAAAAAGAASVTDVVTQIAGAAAAAAGSVTASGSSSGAPTGAAAGAGSVTAVAVQIAPAAAAGAAAVTAAATQIATAAAAGAGSVTDVATQIAKAAGTGAAAVTAAGQVTGTANVTGAASVTAAAVQAVPAQAAAAAVLAALAAQQATAAITAAGTATASGTVQVPVLFATAAAGGQAAALVTASSTPGTTATPGGQP